MNMSTKTYKVRTKEAYTAIKNGWLFNAQDAINKVYDELRKMIKANETYSVIKIFHAQQVKQFVEKVHNGYVEIQIIENTVCSRISIRLNVDFDILSESEIYELKQKAKKDLFS